MSQGIYEIGLMLVLMISSSPLLRTIYLSLKCHWQALRGVFVLITFTFLFTISLANITLASDIADKYMLQADSVVSGDNETYIATGNVIATFKNTILTADKVIYYPKDKVIDAHGNVHIQDDVQSLSSDRATYRIDTEIGDIDNVTGSVYDEYYICARKITRVTPDHYIMYGARVTTCKGNNPDWSFVFTRLEGELDGYLYGDSVTANVRSTPILYSPKLFYPLKINRQSGFLIPSIGYTTDLGFRVSEDFFWAIDYDKDATLGATYFSERGVMASGEFRYAVSNRSNIYLAFDLMDDSDTTADVDGRWRTVSKSVLRPTDNLEFLFDGEMISDYMFMRDFEKFYRYDFERNKENVFYHQYHILWDTMFGDVSIKYRNDYKYNDAQKGYVRDYLIQQPSLSIIKYGVDLKLVSLDYDLEYSKVKYGSKYFDYDNGTIKNEGDYQRLHGHTRMYRNISTKFAMVTPYIEGNYTKWFDLGKQERNAVTDSWKSFSYLNKTSSGYERLLPKMGLRFDLNEVYRYYGDNKHTIYNEIVYEFVPKLNQQGVINYLEDDLIDRGNRLTYSMTNYLEHGKISHELILKQGVNLYKNSDRMLAPLEVEYTIGSPLITNKLEFNYDYTPPKQKNNTGSIINLKNTTSLRYENFKVYSKYEYLRNRNLSYNSEFEVGGSIRHKRLGAHTWVILKANSQLFGTHGFSPKENGVGVSYATDCWSTYVDFSSEKYTRVTKDGTRVKREYKVELTLTLKGLGASSASIYNRKSRYD